MKCIIWRTSSGKKETAVVSCHPFTQNGLFASTLVKQSHTLDCLVFSTTVIYLVGYELELFSALRCLMCVSLEQPRPLLRPHEQQAFATSCREWDRNRSLVFCENSENIYCTRQRFCEIIMQDTITRYRKCNCSSTRLLLFNASYLN